MWKVLLLAVPMFAGQDISVDCSSGAGRQTQSVAGPAGVSAVLKVLSAGDHSKDQHECMAEYRLVVQRAGGAAPVETSLLSSDGDWGRRLSARLEGFSRDGKRVFGVLSEGGRYASASLFEYEAGSGQATLIDLKKARRILAAAKCGDGLAVAGTTEAGAVVLQPSSAEPCDANYRWQIDPATGVVRRLPSGQAIVALYGGA